MLNLDAQTRMALGATLACIAAVSIVLALLLGWSGSPRPWGFLLGFLTGVIAGLGATLATSGLVEYRRRR